MVRNNYFNLTQQILDKDIQSLTETQQIRWNAEQEAFEDTCGNICLPNFENELFRYYHFYPWHIITACYHKKNVIAFTYDESKAKDGTLPVFWFSDKRYRFVMDAVLNGKTIYFIDVEKVNSGAFRSKKVFGSSLHLGFKKCILQTSKVI